MVPIFEQGSGNGIGHSVESFLAEFEKIAIDHVQKGRAKSIAFIFYDFNDREFKRVLRNEGVFTQLDRLSGDRLSVFFMHSGSDPSDQVLLKFNSVLMSALGVEDKARKPCVVFCNANSEGLSNISVANLDSADLIHGFHELYGVIESYLHNEKPETKSINWMMSGAKSLSVEMIRDLIKALIISGMF
ncbi:hypothetical protein MHB_0003715 [Pseudomonas fluorescens BBc6R8]|uniref:hypothetical protein n=1 Tax=Pseudomonas fluorescens TaxID=294 RepID=UPI000281C8B9|nr:hypothetical protein [Pseudomonas fluorescens]QQD55393.1 hypothetical protein MHB_0003715 [Pseudomonas fluorescens BBc6R8]